MAFFRFRQPPPRKTTKIRFIFKSLARKPISSDVVMVAISVDLSLPLKLQLLQVLQVRTCFLKSVKVIMVLFFVRVI
jgi:hypothetical protein